MRHVIIEGPDGSGKTTLSTMLCKEQGMGYHHEGPPPPGVDLLHYYAGLLVNAPQPTVFDRLHLGEVVYGSILRGGSRLAPYHIRLMNRLIAATGSTVVTCMAPWSTCLCNTRSKEELIKDEGLLNVAHKTWNLVFGNRDLLCNCCYYDYTQGRAFEVPLTDECPNGVVGSPHAKVLFVGEQPNGAFDLPFFSDKGSSRFLNDAIDDAGFEEDDIAFTNAVSAKGVPRNPHLLLAAMPTVRHVVLLGLVAKQDWQRPLEMSWSESITPHYIPHPAYWKRFKAGREEEYTDMLRKVRHAA